MPGPNHQTTELTPMLQREHGEHGVTLAIFFIIFTNNFTAYFCIVYDGNFFIISNNSLK